MHKPNIEMLQFWFTDMIEQYHKLGPTYEYFFKLRIVDTLD